LYVTKNNVLLQRLECKGYLAGESFRAATKSFSSDTNTAHKPFKVYTTGARHEN